MATTPTITRADFPGYSLIKDADADLTAEKDVMAGPCRLTHIYVDNTLNAAQVEYLKLYDDINPTPGTTEPDWVFKIPANGVIDFPVNPGRGAPFANGLSFACAQQAGRAATTGPSNDVPVVLTVLPGLS